MQTRQALIVVGTVDLDVLSDFPAERLADTVERLLVATGAHDRVGKVGVHARPVPIAMDRLAVPIYGQIVVFGNALKQIAGNPGLVASTLGALGKHLKLPLTNHHFSIDSFDIDAGLKAHVEMFVDDRAANGLAGADRAIVWALRSRETSSREADRQVDLRIPDGVFLLEPEPEVIIVVINQRTTVRLVRRAVMVEHFGHHQKSILTTGIGEDCHRLKQAIRDSRVNSTRLLSEAIASLDEKPESFILASAIGWYGDRGEEELSEDSSIGEGFLPEVCQEWEAAASKVEDSGVRTVFLRSGIVLAATGGALGKMLLPFKFGAGGPMGGGRQWMSWVSLDDEIYAIHHLLMNGASKGAYNITAPQPVRQKSFAKTLGKVLRRPAFAPLPGFAVKILFGEMGEKLTLDSQRVIPSRLEEEGYEFLHNDLESALRDSLGLWN